MEKLKVCKKSFDEKSGIVSFAFVNDTTLTLDTSKLSSEVSTRALGHGLLQKIGDAYAGAKGDVNEAIESAQSVIEQLLAGEWMGEREAAGPQPSLVAEAVVRAKTKAGQTFDEAATRAKYTGKDSKPNRDAALKNPAVAAEYEGIRAENAAKRATEAAAKASAVATDVSTL